MCTYAQASAKEKDRQETWWRQGTEAGTFISLQWFLQRHLIFSLSLSVSNILPFTLENHSLLRPFQVHGVEMGVVVSTPRYYEPQGTAISPGHTFETMSSLNSPHISQCEEPSILCQYINTLPPATFLLTLQVPL